MLDIRGISFEIADELTEWPVLTIAVLTPAGGIAVCREARNQLACSGGAWRPCAGQPRQPRRGRQPAGFWLRR